MTPPSSIKDVPSAVPSESDTRCISGNATIQPAGGLEQELPVPRPQLSEGALTVQYLGQEGFCIRDDATSLVIDPYLSDSVDRQPGFPPGYWRRNYAPPVRPENLDAIDLVLCTHDHLDHTDPSTLLAIAAASPACLFGGPRASVEIMHAVGLPPTRTRVLNDNMPYRRGKVAVQPVPAAHEDYEMDAEGFHRFLGYLIHWGGRTLYHAGDTVVTPALSARLERERIDLGFLPINGGDEYRRKMGVVGNMSAADAADLAARHRFATVVPMHYDLYPCNSAPLDVFVAEFQKQGGAAFGRIKVFSPGEIMAWNAATGGAIDHRENIRSKLQS